MPSIKAIPSKSDAHRAIICANLSKKPAQVIYDKSSEDIDATESCMEAIRNDKEDLFCKESGSTFRFLLPVVGALGLDVVFHLEGSLPSRPLSPLYEELEAHGMKMSPQGESQFQVSGQLEPGDFRLPGDVSSQFISGLLFATPILDGDSNIIIEGNLESKSYVDMTLKTLEDFNIKIKKIKDGYFIKGKQKYKRKKPYIVEGDWSNSANFLVAGAFLDQGISVTGLNMDSLQGDRAIVDLLEDFGAKISIDDQTVSVSKGKLKAQRIDAANIPDLIPVLSILASQAQGKTEIINGQRLRYKESDRINSSVKTLEKFGVHTSEYKDGFDIYGKEDQGLSGNYFSSYRDHRIAMAVSVGSILADSDVILENPQAVNKSYPDFYEDFSNLGLDKNLVLEED